MFTNPKSTIYQRPDIEYQGLTQNNILDCTPGPAVSVLASLPPKAFSTGNGIIYLKGELNVDQQINGSSILVTLPIEYPVLEKVEGLVVLSQPGGTPHESIPIVINTNNEVRTRVSPIFPILVNSKIFLDGLFYIQKVSG